MSRPPLEAAVRRIRSLTAPVPDGLSDGDLLIRFRNTRDEAAFAELVRRHGPAVLGVCRRVLTDRHAAEDAFQATFLVLARRAGGIRQAGAVGGWLHGVAFRVATKLKGQRARQPRAMDIPDVSVESGDDLSWREVRRVLDEEVTRLPERLRWPVLLCYFEGKTRDEAADALGWKLTTLRGRLEDGRLRLRDRLARRGVELSAALLAVSAATDGVAVEGPLIASTVRGAVGSAADPIQGLAKGIAMSSLLGKGKLMAGALVLAVGLGTTLLAFRGQAGETPGSNPSPKAPEPAPKVAVPVPAPKAAPWGDPAGDFRLRLRPPAAKLKAGDFPELVCDLKYTGKERQSVYHLWERAGVELDGQWYTCHREGSFGGRSLDIAPDTEHPAWMTVRPDAQWMYLRDGKDPDFPHIKEAVPFRLTAGKHTLRVAYTLARDVRAVSNPVTIEVGPDGWGEPAAGLKARLRVANGRLKPGDPLPLELDLRSERPNPVTAAGLSFACEVSFDGAVYTYLGPFDVKSMRKELKPGGEATPFVSVEVDAGWKADQTPFRLTPGKHKVRVTFPLDDPKARLVTNTIEIEVAADPPLDPAVRALALAADRIWVVPSPTRDKPVPAAEQVLKGPPAPAGQSAFDLRLLPADDPKQKWVAFLAAEDEGRPTPAVARAAGPRWYVPYDEATARAIRAALLPAEWGKEKDGLQAGLRLRAEAGSAGQPADPTTPAAPGVRGKVTHVGRGGTNLAQIDIGSDSGLAAGSSLIVYRGNEYLGDLKLTTVNPKVAVGKFTPARPGAEIRKDDPVHLQPGKPRRAAGQPIVAEVTIRNVGTAERVVRHHRYNIYDYWPGTRFHVTAPDGSRWILHKPDGPMSEADALHPVRLKPGETYVQAMRLNRWAAYRENPRGEPHVPNLFTAPGEYSVACRYVPTDVVGEAGWEGGLGSNPVTLSVTKPDPKAPPWGEPADGLRARLRLPVTSPRNGGPLKFDLDLRNDGRRARNAAADPTAVRVQLDGRWFAFMQFDDAIRPRPAVHELKPDGELTPLVSVTADQSWLTLVARPGRPGDHEAVPLALSPGKHKLAAQLVIDGTTRVTTPTIEIDVRADDWGDPAGGVQARVRLGRTKFRTGEPLEFELDLKNAGKETYGVSPVPQMCELELDDAWYTHGGPINVGVAVQRLAPGQEAVPFVKPVVTGLWTRVPKERGGSGGPPAVVPLVLGSGRYRLRVAYPVKDGVKPISLPVGFEVVTDEAAVPDLKSLTDRADRIVVAKIDWQAGRPRLKEVRPLKGPNTRVTPDFLPLTVPVGTELPPADGADTDYLLFLKAEEDGAEVPKLFPVAVRGWCRPATKRDQAEVLERLREPTPSGPAQRGVALALRPAAEKVRIGDEVRMDFVMSHADRGTLRVLQQRYNVYDYWPFLTFTVTRPDGRRVTLAKPEGLFKREDYVDEFVLKEGESYIHTVRLARWPAVGGQIPREMIPRSVFSEPGTYKVQATYKVPPTFQNLNPRLQFNKWPFWGGELSSNIVTIVVEEKK